MASNLIQFYKYVRDSYQILIIQFKPVQYYVKQSNKIPDIIYIAHIVSLGQDDHAIKSSKYEIPLLIVLLILNTFAQSIFVVISKQILFDSYKETYKNNKKLDTTMLIIFGIACALALFYITHIYYQARKANQKILLAIKLKKNYLQKENKQKNLLHNNQKLYNQELEKQNPAHKSILKPYRINYYYMEILIIMVKGFLGIAIVIILGNDQYDKKEQNLNERPLACIITLSVVIFGFLTFIIICKPFQKLIDNIMYSCFLIVTLIQEGLITALGKISFDDGSQSIVNLLFWVIRGVFYLSPIILYVAGKIFGPKINVDLISEQSEEIQQLKEQKDIANQIKNFKTDPLTRFIENQVTLKQIGDSLYEQELLKMNNLEFLKIRQNILLDIQGPGCHNGICFGNLQVQEFPFQVIFYPENQLVQNQQEPKIYSTIEQLGQICEQNLINQKIQMQKLKRYCLKTINEQEIMFPIIEISYSQTQKIGIYSYKIPVFQFFQNALVEQQTSGQLKLKFDNGLGYTNFNNDKDFEKYLENYGLKKKIQKICCFSPSILQGFFNNSILKNYYRMKNKFQNDQINIKENQSKFVDNQQNQDFLKNQQKKFQLNSPTDEQFDELLENGFKKYEEKICSKLNEQLLDKIEMIIKENQNILNEYAFKLRKQQQNVQILKDQIQSKKESLKGYEQRIVQCQQKQDKLQLKIAQQDFNENKVILKQKLEDFGSLENDNKDLQQVITKIEQIQKNCQIINSMLQNNTLIDGNNDDMENYPIFIENLIKNIYNIINTNSDSKKYKILYFKNTQIQEFNLKYNIPELNSVFKINPVIKLDFSQNYNPNQNSQIYTQPVNVSIKQQSQIQNQKQIQYSHQNIFKSIK
ncbi:hypothetical protein PPERSA_07348 [Pseudocohnilembus persalinus]|uniref:Transmembrane protein n=1 Tax=Pseudocohnilembus persalinus TaxID=266149 RepID=A0A0V0QAK1_PSEPJ|nr:hypothetical protein PPERSA_07348 [Pseudocohnilembus persalinus]|eukprot:KRW99095.1 hypothetical protein PPERSA_07348 [Pseudocohnilembus persalinus]